MAKSKKRMLKTGDTGFILYYGYPYMKYPKNCLPAKVLEVNRKKQYYKIEAIYNYKFFIFLRFQDASNFFFFDKEEAENVQKNLPKASDIWYRIIGNKVYERRIYGLKSDYSDEPCNYYYIKILFCKGNPALFDELGKTVFKTYEEAVNALERLNE